MNKYITQTSAKYEVISMALGKTHQSVKKYFNYNNKNVHDQMHVQEYFNKENEKKYKKKFEQIFA